jgi:hypothetical protein
LGLIEEALAGGYLAFGIAGLNQPVTTYFDAGDTPYGFIESAGDFVPRFR